MCSQAVSVVTEYTVTAVNKNPYSKCVVNTKDPLQKKMPAVLNID